MFENVTEVKDMHGKNEHDVKRVNDALLSSNGVIIGFTNLETCNCYTTQ